MMKTFTIEGGSDDHVTWECGKDHDQIDGDPVFLLFSDGSLIRCEYSPDSSCAWRISQQRSGSGSFAITQTGDEDNGTDIATLSAPDLRMIYRTDDETEIPDAPLIDIEEASRLIPQLETNGDCTFEYPHGAMLVLLKALRKAREPAPRQEPGQKE